MKTILLRICAFVAFTVPTVRAEIIGVEQFDYPNGSVANQTGGTFWDYKNFTTTGHTGTASTWDNFTAAPVVTNGRLVTDNSSAKREYNGALESDGAVNDPASVPSSVAKTVYYRVTFTTSATLPSFISVSSSDFGTDIVSFGVSMDFPNDNKFSFRIHPLGFISNSATLVAPNTTYTLVTKLDYTNNVVSLWLNPDLNAAEGTVTPLDSASNFTPTNWSTAVRLASGTGGAVTWDNLVVATTWDDLGTDVTTTADENNSLNPANGTGVSLREAVNYSPSGTLITFAPALSGKTIPLTGGELAPPAAGILTIDGSSLSPGVTIDGNDASRLFVVDSGRSLTLRALTLTGGNGAGANGSGSGGALYNNGGILRVLDCTLTGNRASDGGAIYSNTDLALQRTEIKSCTITGNTATGVGGGVRNFDGATLITACTISGNTAPGSGGGGVASYGDAVTLTTLDHTIVSANSGSDVLFTNSATNSFTSTGYNMVGLGNGVAAFTTTIGDQTGVTDPKLTPLGYFGGPTMTMHPLIGSPAIETGGATNPGGTDQRGFSRFADGDDNLTPLLDIGAVECGVPQSVSSAGDSGGPSLRNGMSIAASTPGGRVRFLPGTFPASTITLSGTELSVPAGASVFIDASNLSGPVTVSGNNLSRVFNIASGATLAAHNLALINGHAPDGAGNSDGGNGGGILNDGTLSLFSCSVSNHRAGAGGTDEFGGTGGAGGGIFSTGRLGAMACIFSGNRAGNGASGGDGGGIHSTGSFLSLTGCILSGNFAGDASTGSFGGSGGGLSIPFDLTTSATFTSCQFTDNRAGNGGTFVGGGGGIFCGVAVRMTSCLVARNAANGSGGGIRSSNSLAMDSCSILSNQGGAVGGGLAISGNSTLLHSTIAGNEANRGGGIHLNSGFLRIEHCTVSANHALSLGGGLFHRNNGGANYALVRSIIAGNTSPSGPDILHDSGALIPTTEGANLVGSLSGAGTFTGPPPITGDAKLAPLSDYGGPTFTMLPLPGSPAINAAIGSTATSDQRGLPMNGVPDLGAVEVQAALVGFTDTDSDGMDDRLEPLYGFIVGVADGNLDADGDGSKNADELGNKTGPRDSASLLRILTFTKTGSNINVTWTTFPGLSYTLEYGTTLSFGGIVGLGAATGMTSGNTIGPFTGPVSFFRIRRE